MHLLFLCVFTEGPGGLGSARSGTLTTLFPFRPQFPHLWGMHTHPLKLQESQAPCVSICKLQTGTGGGSLT